MKSFFLVLVTVFILSLPLSTTVAASGTDSPTWLDTKQLDSGVIGAAFKPAAKTPIVLLITKNGVTYTYKLPATGTMEYFPLQLGDGAYTISLMQNVTGTKYKKIGTESVNLNLSDDSSVFLGSVQNVNWRSSPTAVAKAKELTKNKTKVEDKVKAIHDYIVKTIKYDTKLSTSVTTDYIPDANRTLKSGKGICYDYSSLFAVMARSAGIPTKLVMGTTDYVKGYHAWNQVMINGKWSNIDTTVDSGLGKTSTSSSSMFKEAGKYAAAKFY